MTSRPIATLALLVALPFFLSPAPAPAAEPDPRIVREAEIFDQELADLWEAKDAERSALQAYQAASEQFFAQAGSSDTTLEQARSLERALASKREDFVQNMRKTQDALVQVFEQAERVRDLYDRANARSADPTELEEPMDGAWSFSIQQFGDFGVVDLDEEGGTVRGRYRLKNGNTGTLEGSFSGGLLRLESFKSGQELTAQLEGTLSADGDLVEGTYNLTVLNAPVPVQGTWKLRRVSRAAD